MQMNKREQTWLVLLYTLVELSGGGTKSQVLEEIQNNQYWVKNDSNDKDVPSRKEKSWRNYFSFERQHLVEHGYMQSGVNGMWLITESGRDQLQNLIGKARNIDINKAKIFFTKNFYKDLLREQLKIDIIEDDILNTKLSETYIEAYVQSINYVNVPLAKGPTVHHNNNKITYYRDPIISSRALQRANNKCEIDQNHTSFMRRNKQSLYMEPHHLIPISMTDFYGVSLDREQNIFSLCSNCHNQIHYGTKEDIKQLLASLFNSRKEEICSILNDTITLEDLYRIYKVN